jgi:UDP-N-acetylmuramoyl-tripeptide--D-alanyl-D-alanine ligase
MSAIAIARILGLDYKDIAAALADFSFPPNRLNLIELENVQFINDTYNSNPSSLAQALEVLRSLPASGRKIFVMGDMLELGVNSRLFHSRAGRLAARVCDIFLTVGKLSESAACAAKTGGFDTAGIFTCDNSSQAREILFNKISPVRGDVVLVKGSRSMKMEEVFKK